MATRILLVDDSVVARRVLAEALAREPGFEVVGSAPNGRAGVRRAVQLAPDVVILDVEMPEMNGLETLAEMRRRWPRLPIIMFSGLTERGASVTMDALLCGASDYCAKPAGCDGGAGVDAVVREALAPKIRALCTARAVAAERSPTPARVPAGGPVEALLIGSSTGGPNALGMLVAGLVPDLGVPILVTQHMPPQFTRLLAERLTSVGPIAFREAEAGMPLETGCGYVAPGDRHLLVAGAPGARRLALDAGPPESSCRPAVDPMLRSAVAAFGSGVLAVVLTGMGQDGLRGCEAVRAAGGQILVQDEATSVVWGMPGAVARAGIADEVLPIGDVAPAILRRIRRTAATAAQVRRFSA